MDQPYGYRRHGLSEPDWRRLPGWRDVTRADCDRAASVLTDLLA